MYVKYYINVCGYYQDLLAVFTYKSSKRHFHVSQEKKKKIAKSINERWEKIKWEYCENLAIIKQKVLKKITIAVVGPFKLPKHQEYVTPFFTDTTLMTIVTPKVIQKNPINFHLF